VALEDGLLTINVRLLPAPAHRRYLTVLLHQVILVARPLHPASWPC
jgi:hypothetical protein